MAASKKVAPKKRTTKKPVRATGRTTAKAKQAEAYSNRIFILTLLFMLLSLLFLFFAMVSA